MIKYNKINNQKIKIIKLQKSKNLAMVIIKKTNLVTLI